MTKTRSEGEVELDLAPLGRWWLDLTPTARKWWLAWLTFIIILFLIFLSVAMEPHYAYEDCVIVGDIIQCPPGVFV